MKRTEGKFSSLSRRMNKKMNFKRFSLFTLIIFIMMKNTQGHSIRIPTELIGSLPRSAEIVEAQRAHKDGELTTDQLIHLQEKDIEHVLSQLEQTGSPQLTDGELTKPSFLSYPIYEITQYNFSFDDENVTTITFTDGHQRLLPQLIAAPFRYATFAIEYLHRAQKYTEKPLKQAVIAPSTLSLVYPRQTIENYTREEFLHDLLFEAEKEIRLCLAAGAEKVQLDFPDAQLSLKLDPTGNLLKHLIEINNSLLDRFDDEEKTKLGVHVCSGNDNGTGHSLSIDYSRLFMEIFQLHLCNFYLPLSCEDDPESILMQISAHLQSHHRIFIGVINPMNLTVETPEQVKDRIFLASKYIPIAQLGTTDDCGFAPYDDNEFLTRDICFMKIKARVEGTKLAERILNHSMST